MTALDTVEDFQRSDAAVPYSELDQMELEARRHRRKVNSLVGMSEGDLAELCTAFLQARAPRPLKPTCVMCVNTVERRGELCFFCTKRVGQVMAARQAVRAPVAPARCPDCRQPVNRRGMRCTPCGVKLLKGLVARAKSGGRF